MLKAICPKERRKKNYFKYIPTMQLGFCLSSTCAEFQDQGRMNFSVLKWTKMPHLCSTACRNPTYRFHPGRMQMHRKTNVKSIKLFIKHLRVLPATVCLSVASTVAFSPRCHIVSCIITGVSPWTGTTLNKAGGGGDGWWGPGDKVISPWTCKQIYNSATLINVPDNQKWKCHMSIIKTS